MLKGALAGGSVGFLLGFFGPILVSPSSHQGPLLGIFFTGPAGFVLGGIYAGIVRRLKWTPRKSLGWGVFLGIAMTVLGIERHRVGESALFIALGTAILGVSGWVAAFRDDEPASGKA